jgi:hypothetical protein
MKLCKKRERKKQDKLWKRNKIGKEEERKRGKRSRKRKKRSIKARKRKKDRV